MEQCNLTFIVIRVIRTKWGGIGARNVIFIQYRRRYCVNSKELCISGASDKTENFKTVKKKSVQGFGQKTEKIKEGPNKESGGLDKKRRDKARANAKMTIIEYHTIRHHFARDVVFNVVHI